MRFALKGDKLKTEMVRDIKDLEEEIEDLEYITESLEKDIKQIETDFETTNQLESEEHQKMVDSINHENESLRKKLQKILLRA